MLVGREITASVRPGYLWIDALCINQNDLSERNDQVSLMADIFKAAQGVVIWLGEEDEFTQDAFTVIERLSSIPRDRWKLMPYTGFYGDGKCLADVGIEPPSLQQWLGFLAFINRPWFSRAWVVQELALCRTATVVCGGNIVPWSKLSKTIEFIRYTKWYHHLSTEKLKHLPEARFGGNAHKKLLESNTRFDITPMYLNYTRDSVQSYLAGQSRQSPSFRLLVDAHRTTKATDPRDKVYAFLSLANRGRSASSHDPGLIQADYQRSVQQVYTQAASTLLHYYKCLYLLSHVQDQSLTKIPGLPSWVPDYSVALQPYSLQFRGNCNWSACGELEWTPPKNEDSTDTGLLPVQGFLIDTIADTAVMPYEAADAAEPWASIVNLVSNLPNPYPIGRLSGSPISRVEALWRTLTTNTYSRQHPAPSHCRALFVDYILNLSIRHRLAPWSSQETDFHPHQTPTSTLVNPGWRDLLAAEPPDSPYSILIYRKRLAALVEDMISKDSYSPIELAQLHHDIENGSGRVRRLFRTKDRTLLGTGAKSLRRGDEVWILAGGQVPYILRRVEGVGGPEDTKEAKQTGIGSSRHRLVGEAYVHGIMHGDPYRHGCEMVSTVLE